MLEASLYALHRTAPDAAGILPVRLFTSIRVIYDAEGQVELNHGSLT